MAGHNGSIRAVAAVSCSWSGEGFVLPDAPWHEKQPRQIWRTNMTAQTNRRNFLKSTALTGGVLAVTGTAATSSATESTGFAPTDPAKLAAAGTVARLPDLRPAGWIWYPSSRTLANTMILFRHAFDLPTAPRRATGWILGSSRYLLFANGRRIQFGPAPCDPRFEEMDPVDLTQVLQAGRNALGVQVLYYGHGDGTWPVGKPGLIFWLEIELTDGQKRVIASGSSWQAHYARAWRPGQFKRWYLRALQEDFDARYYPHGWQTLDFTPGQEWVPAMVLDGPSDKPPVATSYPDYALDVGASRSGVELRPRSIPLLREQWQPVQRIAESLWLEWRRPAEEYFELGTPESFKVDRSASAKETAPGVWEVEMDGLRAAALTFEFAEQIVGWPAFTIEAPAGTVVELMTQEAHAIGGVGLLNTHFHAWSRFTCRAGVNRFEAFDFESLRWLQLHIRSATGRIQIREVGVRRRQFPWPHEPQIRTSEPALQRLIDASINTLHNSAQETVVDGMGRERQQYSGDGGHQLHAIYFAFGESRLPARFVRTFSQGLTLDGYFLDCWPAYDRLARLMERQLGLTPWGPLLDHGVGFNFDCYYYYQYTGDLQPLAEAYPRLLRFAQYLRSIQGRDGLLPVENLGVPAVWMDHQAYRRQRHKQCAFNLYAAAMLEHALPAIAGAFGDEANAASARRLGSALRRATVTRYWSPTHRLFINNLPWLAEEKEIRTCDRSLATAILFDQCPDGRVQEAISTLATAPPGMGESYPCNAGWRYWALAKAGCVDVVLRALRERWATMPSVLLNNTLQEDWMVQPDSGSQWSHCAVVPLYILFMSVAGLSPLAPGFKRVEIRPQLGDLESLTLRAHTIRGPIRFESQGRLGSRCLSLELPPGCEGELVLAAEENVSLPRLTEAPSGFARYQMAAGNSVELTLVKT
jgi:hypothetical protein